jgi:hypothetical protein
MVVTYDRKKFMELVPGDPEPSVSGGPAVDVRVEGGNDGVVEGKLDVEKARNLRQKG